MSSLPNNNNDGVNDAMRLVQELEKLNSKSGSILNELANLSRQMYELRVDVVNYTADAAESRLRKSNAEETALQAELDAVNRKLEALRDAANGRGSSTSEKIKAVVSSELRRGSIDWNQVRQAVIIAVLCSLAVAIIWQVINLLAQSTVR